MLKSNWIIPLIILALIPLDRVIRDKIDPYFVRILMLIGVNVILAVSLQLINGISGQFSLGHAGFMAVGAYLAAYPLKAYSQGMQNPPAVLGYYLGLWIVVGIAAAVLYAIFRGIRLSGRIHGALPAVLLLGLAVWFLVDFARADKYGESVPAYFVWSRSLDLLSRAFAFLTTNIGSILNPIAGWIPEAMRAPLSFLTVLIGGAVCAAMMGLLVGLPTLRLRGDYLAIATLGFSEIIRIAITNSAPLGGATGLTAVPRYTSFAWLYAFVLITIVIVWRVTHSAVGRSIAAVREDEIAASASGIDPTRSKVLAFVIGAFFAGIAGGLSAHMTSLLHPGEFGFLRSVELVVMVTLGGLGSISGAILTAAVLTWLPEQLRSFNELRMILYSVLLIAMMLLRPQGLLGKRELWWRRRRNVPALDELRPIVNSGGGHAAP